MCVSPRPPRPSSTLRTQPALPPPFAIAVQGGCLSCRSKPFVFRPYARWQPDEARPQEVRVAAQLTVPAARNVPAPACGTDTHARHTRSSACVMHRSMMRLVWHRVHMMMTARSRGEGPAVTTRAQQPQGMSHTGSEALPMAVPAGSAKRPHLLPNRRGVQGPDQVH
jgi:hypothetical protein